MALRLHITSNQKGSNPGGSCTVFPMYDHSFKAYFKYCSGARFPHGVQFRPENQPIYEAITFKLARELGLHAPDTYVLKNKNRDIIFDTESDVTIDHSGRDFYFVSRCLSGSGSFRESLSNEIIEEESPFLNSLLIDDIKNKPHNYFLQKDEHGLRVFYLDLGCSFVRAVGGNLSLSNTVKKILSKGDTKRARRLKGKMIVSADNSKPVDLEGLVFGLENLEIPVLNSSAPTKKISDLLGHLEIEQIRQCVAYGFLENLGEFKSRGLIFS